MSRRLSTIFVVLALVFCVTMLYWLLLLEFESGDAYPAFSSYRPDPIGLLAINVALDALPGPAPARNIVPIVNAAIPDGATLLFAGALPSPDPVRTLEKLETFVDGGGRLVILFQPGASRYTSYFENDSDDEEEGDAEGAEEEPQEDSGEPEDMMDVLQPTADISERWGFEYSVQESLSDTSSADLVPDAQIAGDLPPSLPWHSTLAFRDLTPEWTPLYTRETFPVVMERSFGDGTIVIASDNYALTNEALRHDRFPTYIAWLLDPERAVVFEETHLGVVKSSGVMTLMKRYRLIPLLLSIAILLGLFIWRNAASLVPRNASLQPDVASERAPSAVDGIANLVRRSIDSADLIETCWRLYAERAARVRRLPSATETNIENVLSEYRSAGKRRRNPVAAYNAIQALVNERNPKP